MIIIIFMEVYVDSTQVTGENANTTTHILLDDGSVIEPLEADFSEWNQPEHYQPEDTTLQSITSVDVPSVPQGHRMITRHKAKEQHISLVACSNKEILREPNSTKEALRSPYWLEAMHRKSMFYKLTRQRYWCPNIPELILQLGKEFARKDLGSLHFFLGVDVKYFEGGIHLSNSTYSAKLFDKTYMTLAKGIATPLPQNHGLHEAVGNIVDAFLYKMIVGSLQYLILTRPDITHVMNLASQFMQSLNIEYLKGVKRILRYIKGANCISWTYTKQTIVARSSAEVEYRALDPTREIAWIIYLLHDIWVFLKSGPTLYCDNLSALYLSVNPVMHARTKHFEMDYHFVREKMEARSDSSSTHCLRGSVEDEGSC
ncbi:hypothetical protein KY290_036854 [Solanum tuberosum]|uniref:Reverse transcriptase Ty1/copia-type domain-containing protein n=1 Tax=Solanum tuberosum TaxID=4113 RepID=A0ABQ7TV74_SOLTU|nr:hypothetical protein KY290_036854 [Solanum tuberosum]